MTRPTTGGPRTRIPASPRVQTPRGKEVDQPGDAQGTPSPCETHLEQTLPADAAANVRRVRLTRRVGTAEPLARMPAGQAELLEEVDQRFKQARPDAARELLSVQALCARFGPAVITLAYEGPSQADHYLNRYAHQLADFILVLDGLPQIAEKYGYAACNNQLPARVREQPAITVKPQRQPAPLQALENFRYVRELLTWFPQQLAKKDSERRAELKALQKNVLSDLQLCAEQILAQLPTLTPAMPRLAGFEDLLKKLAAGDFPEGGFEALHKETAKLAHACVPGKEEHFAMESAPATQRERAAQIVELRSDETLGGRKILLRSSPLLLHDLDLVEVEKQSKQETVTASITGVTSLLRKELDAQALGTVFPLMMTNAQIARKNAENAHQAPPPKVRAGAVAIELYDDDKTGIKQVARSQNKGLLLADFTLFKS